MTTSLYNLKKELTKLFFYMVSKFLTWFPWDAQTINIKAAIEIHPRVFHMSRNNCRNTYFILYLSSFYEVYFRMINLILHGTLYEQIAKCQIWRAIWPSSYRSISSNPTFRKMFIQTVPHTQRPVRRCAI